LHVPLLQGMGCETGIGAVGSPAADPPAKNSFPEACQLFQPTALAQKYCSTHQLQCVLHRLNISFAIRIAMHV